MTPAEFAAIRRSVGLCADCGRDAGTRSRCAKHLATHRAKARARHRSARRVPKRLPRETRVASVVSCVWALFDERGAWPTTRDIADSLGIRARRYVARLVNELVASGVMAYGQATRCGRRVELVTTKKAEEKAA